MWPLDHISRQERQLRTDVVAAYEQCIANHVIDGSVPFYGNLMFNHISGGRDRKKSIMQYEVKRMHDLLTRYIVRERDAELCKLWRPILYGCHDEKVSKRGAAGCSRLFLPNGGAHFNFIILMRAIGTAPVNSHVKKLARTLDLVGHFRDCRHLYVNDVVGRLFITPVLEGNMTGYMLKTFKHGGADWNDIVVLK